MNNEKENNQHSTTITSLDCHISVNLDRNQQSNRYLSSVYLFTNKYATCNCTKINEKNKKKYIIFILCM